MVSYKKLWKMLIDKDMLKKDLIEKADISQSTLRKLNHGDNLTTDILVRICKALKCNIGRRYGAGCLRNAQLYRGSCSRYIHFQLGAKHTRYR